MKKKILILATGGTIASAISEEGLVPELGIESVFSNISGIAENYDISAKDILHMDSSNIQPEEWRIIAQSIYENYIGYDGIIITHGTDTMAYTSSVLSYMLQNVPLPIVMTGSQLPISNPLTDAVENLRCAFAMAASGVPGVFLAFDRKVILGTRAVKVRTTGFDAFESVNSPYAGVIDSTGLKINRAIIKKNTGDFQLKDNLCPDVFLMKITPGLNPEIFEKLLEMNYRGVVIEAFGAGGLHFIHRDLISKIQKMVEHGIAVVVCSQCLYEKSDFSIYQTGQKVLEQGVIESHDMTTEAAVTKLIWALGQTKDMEKIREIFATDMVGEITL